LRGGGGLGFFFEEMQNGAIWGHFKVSYNIESSTILMTTVNNRTVLKNGSCCTVRPGKVSCLQKFRHFWMIIIDLFFESGSNEATKIKKILQRYVIYISDQITLPYLNTETGNRRLNIVDGMFSLEERG
jgi:hypothetical protein